MGSRVFKKGAQNGFLGRRGRAMRFSLGALLLMLLLPVSTGAVTLTLWDWHEPRANLTQEYAELYMQENPHVTIEISIVSEFLDRLTVALAAGTPPEIVQVHNEWIGRFTENMEPYPEALFPRGRLANDYILFDMTSTIDGEVYFLPLGLMNGAIFYNVGILQSMGYEEPPLVWSEFAEAAKRLTRVEGDGTISLGGAAINADYPWILTDLVYQGGGTLFTDSGVTFNSEPYREGAQFLIDLVNSEVDGSGLNFANGTHAMRYAWTWYEGTARNVEFEYDVSMIPTFTGESLPARGRANVEAGLAVTRDIPAESKDEAFRFIHWLWNHETFIPELNLRLGTIPSNPDLWGHPDIQASPAMQALMQQAPYTVFPGPVDGWYWDLLIEASDRIKAGEPVGPVLEDVQRRGDAQFATSTFRITEGLYSPPSQ